MKSCDLCGAEAGDKVDVCQRCGFEFPKSLRNDVRDEAILKKYQGKGLDEVKMELKIKQTRLTSFLENMDASILPKQELVALMEESLGFLKVPLTLGVEDVLRFSQEEQNFVLLMERIQNKADADHGGPVSTSATYIRLANALQAMERSEASRGMIDKALLINPNNQDALFTKAKLLFYSKEYGAAKRCLEKLIDKGQHPKAGYLAELIDQLSE